MRKVGVPHDTGRYLKVRDVVDQIGFSERTIRAWIASGRLTVVRPLGGRAIRIPERVIADLMSGQGGRHGRV